MRNRRIIISIIITGICCFVMSFYGMKLKQSYSDIGVLTAKKVSDLKDVDLKISPLDQSYAESFTKYEEENVNDYNVASDVVEVEALGEFGTFGMYTQKVKVVQIIKGNSCKINEILEIAGSNYIAKNESGEYEYYSIRGLMQKGKRYLCAINEYWNTYNDLGIHLVGMSSGFSPICLDFPETTKLFNEKRNYKLSELAESNYLCSSKDTLDIVNRTQKKIIKNMEKQISP